MKIAELKKMIGECYQEVLQELDTDDPGVMKISKDDPQKQQKIQKAQQNKQSYELYDQSSSLYEDVDAPVKKPKVSPGTRPTPRPSPLTPTRPVIKPKPKAESIDNNDELVEMARIPVVYKLNPDFEQALGGNEKFAKSSTIQGIVNYLKDKPEGASIIDIAKNAFETPKRQQQLNPLFPALVDAGLITSGGLRSEPKKPSIKKDKSPEFNDAGEETFGGEEDGDADNMFVGFADKYQHEPGGDEEEFMPDELPNGEEDEPIIPQDEPEIDNDFDTGVDTGDTSELEKLTAQKDSLLSKLKSKEITLDQYKSEIGDIPARIKALQKKLSPGEEDDLGPINEAKRRLMKLAGLIKG